MIFLRKKFRTALSTQSTYFVFSTYSYGSIKYLTFYVKFKYCEELDVKVHVN